MFWISAQWALISPGLMPRRLSRSKAGVGTGSAGAAPAMQLRDAQTRLYASPQEDASYEIVTHDPLVIGILGETWYHVWYPDTELSGWMKQDALWPGNG